MSPHTGQNGPSSKNPQILNAGEDMKKREYFCTINGNVNFYNHYGEQNKDYLKKKKKATRNKIRNGPAISLLGIYLRKL